MHSNIPRRAGPPDGYFDLSPSPSNGFGQTPFLPLTPPQVQLRSPASTPEKKTSRIGFQRHRHKPAFRWLFTGGIMVGLVGLVLALFFVYLHMVSLPHRAVCMLFLLRGFRADQVFLRCSLRAQNSEITSYSDGRDTTTISLFGKVSNVDTTNSKVRPLSPPVLFPYSVLSAPTDLTPASRRVHQLAIMWSVKLCDPPTSAARSCNTPPTTIYIFMNENCSVVSQQMWVNTSRTDPSLRIGVYDAETQYLLTGLRTDQLED